KAYLESQPAIEGTFNYVQKRCLCNDYPATFIWDFSTNSSARIKTVVDIIKENGICPLDIAVVPISGDRYYSSNVL
ncbi:prolactin-inducible protein homolog, partial [Nannospalax galili]|uniref:prolactin-inducible protein homolog n=1 Tax=Nannospalax galili TaxID=1026970 RepID=UPI0004ED502F